jgi:hypothetical protein
MCSISPLSLDVFYFTVTNNICVTAHILHAAWAGSRVSTQCATWGSCTNNSLPWCLRGEKLELQNASRFCVVNCVCVLLYAVFIL